MRATAALAGAAAIAFAGAAPPVRAADGAPSADGGGAVPAGVAPDASRSFVSFRLVAPAVLSLDEAAVGRAWYGGVSIGGVAHRTFPSRVLVDISERFQAGFGAPGAITVFDAAFDVGYLLPVARGAGPFAAAGARVSLMLTHPASWLAVELPRAAAGFHADGRGVGLAVFGYAGWLLGGGSMQPGAHGTISRPDVGGRLLIYQIASTTGDYLAVDGRHLIDAPANPGLPADQIGATACLPRLWRFQACLSGSFMQSTLPSATAPAQRLRWRLLSLEIAFDNFARS